MAKTDSKKQPKAKPAKIDYFRIKAKSWDGPHFRLFECGFNAFHESAPSHAMFMDAMEPLGTWEFVLSGAIQYRNGSDRYRVETGEALVSRRPAPGWMLRPVENVPVKTLWINVSGEAALKLFDFLHLKYGQIQKFPADSDVVRRARQLVRLASVQTDRSAYFWSEKTFQWMNAWWRAAEAQHQPLGDARLKALHPSRLISYAPVTIKNFAAEMGYSRAYLTRKLTQQWSRSPGLILREVRLQEAAKQLRTTRLSVNDVATKVGYATAVGFCRAFKQYFKQTPREYRLTHR